MQKLDFVDQASLRSDIPEFRAGDTVKVHVNIVEGTRSRIQVFQGVVIARSGHGVTGNLHRPQGQLPGGCGAYLPSSLSHH